MEFNDFEILLIDITFYIKHGKHPLFENNRDRRLKGYITINFCVNTPLKRYNIFV